MKKAPIASPKQSVYIVDVSEISFLPTSSARWKAYVNLWVCPEVVSERKEVIEEPNIHVDDFPAAKPEQIH